MTISSLLLLNALPEKIRVEERYTYTLELSDTPINRPESATGIIEFRLPYDGYTHLPRATAEKLTEMVAEGTLPSHEAQIGWLLFSAPFNWQGDWLRQAGVSHRYRVVVPFPSDVSSDNPWLSDRLLAQLKSNYTPETPTYRPLEIEAQIFEQLPPDREDYLRDMLRLEAGQLLIFIQINVEVPLALQHEEVEVTLDVLNLDWTTLASRQQIEFYQQHVREDNITQWQQLAWRYNPDTKQVEILGAKHRRVPNLLRQTEQFEFPIYMMLKFPGKILTENELRGNVQISLKNMLLSGYEVAWRGYHPELITPETETHLQATFTILLKDKMAQRKRSAFRRWMFAGVRLDENRRHDLQAALYDLGYKSKEPDDEWQVFNRRFNAEDGSVRELEVLTRLKMLDERSIEYQWDVEGGFLVKNAAPTGNLMVEVYAKMNAPGSLLDFDLEKLMVALQQRWQSVADLL